MIDYTTIGDIYPDLFQEGEEIIVTGMIQGVLSRIGMINGEILVGSEKRVYKVANSLYSFPLTQPSVHKMVETFGKIYRQTVLFGEIFQTKNQFLHYRVIDLYLDGRYLDWMPLADICHKWGVEMTPLLARIPYNQEMIQSLKRGIIIRLLREREHPQYGRVIAKLEL